MKIKQFISAILIIVGLGVFITGGAYAVSQSNFANQIAFGADGEGYEDDDDDGGFHRGEANLRQQDDAAASGYEGRGERGAGRGDHRHGHEGFGFLRLLFPLGLIALIIAGLVYAPRFFRRKRSEVKDDDDANASEAETVEQADQGTSSKAETVNSEADTSEAETRPTEPESVQTEASSVTAISGSRFVGFRPSTQPTRSIYPTNPRCP